MLETKGNRWRSISPWFWCSPPPGSDNFSKDANYNIPLEHTEFRPEAKALTALFMKEILSYFYFLGYKKTQIFTNFLSNATTPQQKKQRDNRGIPRMTHPINTYYMYTVYMGLIIKGTIPRAPAFSLWKKKHVDKTSDKLKTKRSSQPRRLWGLGQLLKKQWQQPSAVFCTAHSIHELRCLGWKMWLNAKNEFCWFLEGKLIISNFVEPNDRTLFI